MDKFSRIEVFVKVIEKESFSKAAESLGITKSAVSKHVQNMEDNLGVRLLNRTTRKLHLTEAGQEFYQRCSLILEELADTESAVKNLSTTPSGRLKISAPLAFGTMYLAPAIADFVKVYPDITIDLNLDGGLVDIINEGYDVAIHIGKLNDSSFIAKKICDCEMMLCASKEYLKKNGEPKTPKELSEHRHIEFSGRQPKRGEWSYEGKANGKIAINEVFGASNGQALSCAAAKGIGIASLPCYVCTNDIKSGKLVPIMTDYVFNGGLAVYALFPHKRNLSIKVRVFIDYVAEKFGNNEVIGTSC